MNYIAMTAKEAYEKMGNVKVLVAIEDLENPDDNICPFKKRTIEECVNILEDAETIVNIYDEFIDSIRAFSHKQPDIFNLIPKGKMSTILLSDGS